MTTRSNVACFVERALICAGTSIYTSGTSEEPLACVTRETAEKLACSAHMESVDTSRKLITIILCVHPPPIREVTPGAG